MIVRIHVTQERVERPVPWGLSLVVHGGLLLWLLWPSSALRKSPSAYDQLIKGHEDKILVYRFKNKLPDVKPLTRSDSRSPRAEVVIAKQSIVSSPKNAPKERQMVWMPAPELKQPPKLDLANLMALKMMPVPAPERKKFVVQSAQPETSKELAKPSLVEAPELPVTKTLTARAVDRLGAMPQPARLKFAVAAAKASTSVAKVEAMAAPAPSSAPLTVAGPSLSELDIAVVGLNPPAKDAKLPEGSRAAQFAAGPKLNPEGGTGKGNPNTSITVPDLVITGGGPDARATLLAMSRPLVPTSAEALRGMSKYSAPSASVTPGAARVSSVPNPKFDGREVYSMAVQMPNITSYSGSWLMWYADRAIGLSGPLAPPVAHRKVDPKYIVSAVVERIEGRVQLLCVINRAGHVGQVELVRGIDPRLDQSAMDALAKWEFTPASRKGEPVDVDVMVEIPFKLAPKETK